MDRADLKFFEDLSSNWHDRARRLAILILEDSTVNRGDFALMAHALDKCIQELDVRIRLVNARIDKQQNAQIKVDQQV